MTKTVVKVKDGGSSKGRPRTSVKVRFKLRSGCFVQVEARKGLQLGLSITLVKIKTWIEVNVMLELDSSWG